MRWEITKEETAVMKGLAIWAIPLHNLLHWTGPLVKENEFFFNYSHRAYWMGDHLKNLHPNLLGDILSFFGWYGVPVFIFLSGYGIFSKYEQASDEAGSWLSFIRYNYVKLFRLLAPAFLVYLLGQAFWGEEPFRIGPVLAQLTLTINAVCAPKDISPGVYWYFGLTLQFYLLYRLLLHKRTDRSFWLIWTILLVADILFLRLMMPDPMLKIQPGMEYIRHNCIGWLLPFLMGVGWAKMSRTQAKHASVGIHSLHPEPIVRIGWVAVILFSFFLLLISSFQPLPWLFSPVFAITATLGIARVLSSAPLRRSVAWLGGISSFLFVVHPVIRPFFREWIFEPGQLLMDARSWAVAVSYWILSVGLACLYKWLLRKIPY